MIARYAVPFFLLMAFVIVPLVIFFLCRWLLPRRWGKKVGIAVALVLMLFAAYGMFVGYEQLEIHQVEYASKDLPKAFDGYRIVQFSDAHVGTMTGRRAWLMQRAVDSILALKPDMIVFTGDLQNIQPQELYPHIDVLNQLIAKDGIYAVLGNHDYAEYIGCDDAIKAANVKEIISLERQMGWNVLLNEHCTIEREKDHIILAGMENDGDGKKFPQKGNISQTLDGVENGDFILMLEHDPSAWRRKIIPDGRSQLTLSGHTHKMQFSLFGWCPMSLTGKEYNGWYQKGNQQLFVTAGLGGLIPFRFGATGEIVVLTLRSH